MKNEPGTFQEETGVLFTKFKGKFALVDLDDIVILYRMPEEHIDQARKALTVLHDAGVTLNLKNCKFLITILITLLVIHIERLEVLARTNDTIRVDFNTQQT